MNKLLIANRGEIAVRIIRSARALGIPTVAVYSEADGSAAHVEMADESVLVGPAQARKSYLDIEAIIGAAKQTNADAIHPGYGFLAENAEFARACADAGIAFVGPEAATIDEMGDKAVARTIARRAGVPVVPGSERLSGDLGEARRLADEIGYPVLIKAAAGGGGRGIRLAVDERALADQIPIASAEAAAAFRDGSLYLERFIRRARHVEIQVLGDGDRAIHLFERDCSLQRRRQKLIEETPAPGLPESLTAELARAAVALARETNYRSAGTVEFLVDSDSLEYFFIEMNTRIQVEHPVTEVVTGIDLIAAQLEIAAGVPLALEQEAVERRGAAIEMRVNAENPELGFLPSPGTIERARLPSGPWVRVDTAFGSGSEVPPFYDSMIAKIIVWAPSRDQAIARARIALGELHIEGIATTKPVLEALLAAEDFRAARHHTAWLEAWLG